MKKEEFARQRVAEELDSGEMVAMKSALALDEDLFCKRCGSNFTLAEGGWEGTHPEYEGLRAYGIQCPSCEIVNVAYYKTGTLFRLEARIKRAKSEKQRQKAIKKYEREFIRVQKTYGNI